MQSGSFNISVRTPRRWLEKGGAFLWVLATLGLAAYGVYLCGVQLGQIDAGVPPPQGTFKFGEQKFEVTANVMGILILAGTIPLFGLALAAFSRAFKEPDIVIHGEGKADELVTVLRGVDGKGTVTRER